MKVYTVIVPVFSGSTDVEFTVETSNSVLTFICNWWDNLWHCAVTQNGLEKRSCVLYPNALYFPASKIYSFKTVTDKTVIGLNDLSGLTLEVGVTNEE